MEEEEQRKGKGADGDSECGRAGPGDRGVGRTWKQCSMAAWQHGSSAELQQCKLQQCRIAAVPNCSSAAVQRGNSAAMQHGSIASVENCTIAAVQHGSIAVLQNCSSAAWQHGSSAAWQHPRGARGRAHSHYSSRTRLGLRLRPAGLRTAPVCPACSIAAVLHRSAQAVLQQCTSSIAAVHKQHSSTAGGLLPGLLPRPVLDLNPPNKAYLALLRYIRCSPSIRPKPRQACCSRRPGRLPPAGGRVGLTPTGRPWPGRSGLPRHDSDWRLGRGLG
jgi:hypothetical protein